MKQLLILAAAILICASAASGQSDTAGNLMVSDSLPAPADSYKSAPAAQARSGEYKKWEFFGGYSAMSFDNLGGDTNNAAVNDVLDDKNTLRGFNLALTYNFHRYIGVKFDYSLHLREDNFSRTAGSGTIDTTVQNFLGGIQFKNNSEDGPRFKPFAHALFGVATQKIDIDSPQLPALLGVNDFSINETSFSMAFGGGVDIKLNDRFDVRAGQIDWNIIRRGDQQFPGVLPGQTLVLPNTRQDNLRLSIGIVIH
ncbi:MAG: outer membrane beta-barrel protein [Acidobacteria bacterium]|nr:outer membrane beta-barrel protein [Acidobacteriota bacterium]